MKTCRKCQYAVSRRPIGVMDIIAALQAGWKGKHFHKERGKFVFC